MMSEPFDGDACKKGVVSLKADAVVNVLRTIHNGWGVATTHFDLSQSAREREMTLRLRTGMCHVVNSCGSALPMRVFPGIEVTSANVPRPVGLTDISIIFDWLPGHSPHLVVECKRIAGNDSKLCRLYVVEGIDRFKSGKYGANHATGIMVGYAIRDTVADAVAGINRYLDGRDRHDDRLKPSRLINDWARRSKHARAGREPVKLHHAFLIVPRTSEEAGES